MGKYREKRKDGWTGQKSMGYSNRKENEKKEYGKSKQKEETKKIDLERSELFLMDITEILEVKGKA